MNGAGGPGPGINAPVASAAEQQVRDAERFLRLTKQVEFLQGKTGDLEVQIRVLRNDFEKLLEHLNLRFEDVPAQRVVRPLKGCPEPAGSGGGGIGI